jgi:hypothetical protein
MAGWRRRYQRAWLRWDLLAGLTTAAVVVPQAVAYASLAGLPVEAGLYVATVPMVAYALLGTSSPGLWRSWAGPRWWRPPPPTRSAPWSPPGAAQAGCGRRRCSTGAPGGRSAGASRPNGAGSGSWPSTARCPCSAACWFIWVVLREVQLLTLDDLSTSAPPRPV